MRSSELVGFYQAGRGLTKEEVQLLQFSACMENDILLACETRMPAVDDYFSTADAAGRVAVGVMMHGIFPQVVEEGLP
eukprot:3990671-Pyramimonas_sp.AAC.1